MKATHCGSLIFLDAAAEAIIIFVLLK